MMVIDGLAIPYICRRNECLIPCPRGSTTLTIKVGHKLYYIDFIILFQRPRTCLAMYRRFRITVGFDTNGPNLPMGCGGVAFVYLVSRLMMGVCRDDYHRAFGAAEGSQTPRRGGIEGHDRR